VTVLIGLMPGYTTLGAASVGLFAKPGLAGAIVSLAVIAPSFYAFYMGLLGKVMPSTYTVLPLLVIGGVLIAAGAALGPETRDVEFEAEVAAESERGGRFVCEEASPAESAGRRV
jgi:hypothetical protein